MVDTAAEADQELFVIVDADTLAGWRRPTSSLAQLHDAVGALRRQAPDAVVAVIADASLKWALSEQEREQIEDDIVGRFLLFAPAGCVGGHVGFIGRVVEKAQRLGFTTVAVTDQAVGDCNLAKVRRDRDGAWVFDLTGTPPPARVLDGTQRHLGPRRRRRG